MRPGFEARQPLRGQGGRLADRRDRLTLAGDGRREAPGAGARVLTGAVQARPALGQGRAQLLEPPGLLRRRGREALVLRRRACEPVDPGHDLVERGRAEDHGERVGLALDIEVAEENGDSPLRRVEGAPHDLRLEPRVGLGAAERGRTALESRLLGLRTGERGFGRIELEHGGRLGATGPGRERPARSGQSRPLASIR